MDLLWKKLNKYTPDRELEEISKRKEEEDIPEWVKEGELVSPECPLKYSGCADKEFWEDYSENIESPKRSTSISNIFTTDTISSI